MTNKKIKTLSEKICLGSMSYGTFFLEEDVKEFIKELKEQLLEHPLIFTDAVIDKLAGEKLT